MSFKKKAFSLLELVIAMGISAIVVTTAVGTVGNVYFAQKKLQVTQDFYSESRFLMERIVQILRNNTIDYDRFFIESGPGSVGCATFNADQTPSQTAVANNDPTESVNRANRLSIGYPNLFYWDTDDDDVQDRQLGGNTTGGGVDPCTIAWNGVQTVLYLIDGARTFRTTISLDGDSKVQIEKQLGADTNNDGEGDVWTTSPLWNDGGSGKCEIDSGGTKYDVLGDETDQEFCESAHALTVISPEEILVNSLIFEPSPDRDPFLAFSIDAAQIHPHVFMAMETIMRNPVKFGFEVGAEPKTTLQTAASSRVFGDPRN